MCPFASLQSNTHTKNLLELGVRVVWKLFTEGGGRVRVATGGFKSRFRFACMWGAQSGSELARQ